MMGNPIIRKEVLMTLRTRKAVAMQAGFLLLLAGLTYVNWPADGLQDVGGEKARNILSILAIGELALVALFAPAFTAATMTMERERKTMESLFATTLKPWEIGLGKMVGSLAFLVLIVISGVPALAAPMMLGGVTGGDVLKIAGLLLLTSVYLGAIGLYISTIMHRSYRSIIVTYAVLLCVFFLLATPAWPVTRNLITRGGPLWQSVMHIMTSFSPLEAMISLVWPGSEYARGAQNMPDFWVLHIPLAIGTIVVLSAICVVKLRHPIAPPRAREKLKVVERGEFSARSLLFLVDPRKRKKMIRWWQNPVLIKEFRTRPMLQTHRLLRIVGICLIVSVVLMLVVTFSAQIFVGEEGMHTSVVNGQTVETVGMIPSIETAVAVLMIVMIILVGPAMASGAISSDRETGIWELLRSTRMPSWRIASGKFQASIIPLLLLVLSMVPALMILLYVETTLWRNMLKVLAVVGMTVLFVSSAGMFFSSLFSRTSTATAWTYGLVVSLGLLTLLILLGREAFSPQFQKTVFMVNPVAAVMEAAGSSQMEGMSLFVPYLQIMAVATAAMFVVTVVRVFQLRRPE